MARAESDESPKCTDDARAPGISLDGYRAERLARLKRQAAKAELGSVKLEQMRKHFRPLLLGMLEYTKSLYPDSSKDSHLIVSALVERLATEISKDEFKDAEADFVCTCKQRRPR